MFTAPKVCAGLTLQATTQHSTYDIAISVISVLHAILILRLYGLYGSKKLAYALSILLAATIAAEVYIVVQYAPTFVQVGLGKEIGNVCVPSVPHNMVMIW